MKNDEHTLVLGGCKSGKSRYAQSLCEKLSSEKRLYVATCVPLDGEMHERVKKHQDDRDMTWNTLEEPIEIADGIRAAGKTSGVILVDCLTLWLTNMLLNDMETEAIFDKVEGLILAIVESPCPVVLVSNEVGAGIVPENALARRFRDLAGCVNQKIAQALDRVVLTVAGLPMILKGQTLV
ncbi:MAG: bifunctional adenosylcobinamide kinase/adenosylcobinamide-phosphate guanylyltransferase [Proteobacteria bacterium]|nr:bifunctional adenosylcobinamide kinase/adenosylcobinamide-phosphate guanylyltransferase [Pseudomonadota bacterium]